MGATLTEFPTAKERSRTVKRSHYQRLKSSSYQQNRTTLKLGLFVWRKPARHYEKNVPAHAQSVQDSHVKFKRADTSYSYSENLSLCLVASKSIHISKTYRKTKDLLSGQYLLKNVELLQWDINLMLMATSRTRFQRYLHQRVASRWYLQIRWYWFTVEWWVVTRRKCAIVFYSSPPHRKNFALLQVLVIHFILFFFKWCIDNCLLSTITLHEIIIYLYFNQYTILLKQY